MPFEVYIDLYKQKKLLAPMSYSFADFGEFPSLFFIPIYAPTDSYFSGPPLCDPFSPESIMASVPLIIFIKATLCGLLIALDVAKIVQKFPFF